MAVLQGVVDWLEAAVPSRLRAAGEGHIRLSYAASRETIVEAVRRIGEVLALS